MASISSVSLEEEGDVIKSEPLKIRLQKKMFSIFNEIIKDRHISFYISIILVPLVFLQMIAYAYDQNIRFPFKDSLYDVASTILSYLRIIPAIEYAHNATIYWLVVYVIILLIILVFLLMVYVNYSIKIGKYVIAFPLKMLSVLCMVFYWVILTPAVESFVAIFLCTDGKHNIAQNLTCWSIEHIVYCMAFTIALLAFLLIIFIISMFNNESSPISLDIFKRTDCSTELFFATYRVLIAILSPFCRSSNMQWLLIIIYLVGAIALVRNYFMYLPYYEAKMSILYGTGAVSYLWVGVNLLLLKLLESVQYTGQTVVIIVGLIVIYPLVGSIRDKIIYGKIFNCRHDKLSSEYELDLYLGKLGEMACSQQLSEIDEMILLGYVTNHKAECANPECPLNSTREFYLPTINKSITMAKAGMKDPIILAHLLSSIYSEYSGHSNATAVVHIAYSYFMFYKMGNIHSALVELSLASKCDNSLQQNFSIYKLKKIIEDSLSKKIKTEGMGKEIRNLDVNIVIIFEGMLQEFQKSIEKSSLEHIEFWAHLDTLLPDLNHLHKLGLSVIQYSKQTHDLWNKLCKINNSYPAALRMYGIYLRDIKNDEELGMKLLDKEKNIKTHKAVQENLNDFEIMFAESTIIIVISGAKETQGKITKTNAGIKTLGYKAKDLSGHDASAIMPYIIGAQHNKFLNRYFTTGKEIILNREKPLFAMHRGRYIVPICLIVKPVSSLENDISYIALIRCINKKFDYILTDNDGKIDSMTAYISGSIDKSNGDNNSICNANFFLENEVFIHLIFPDFMTKVKLPDGKMITRFDALTNGDTMRIILKVPKDFTHAIQQLNKCDKEEGANKDKEDDSHELRKSIAYSRFEESLRYNSKTVDTLNLLKGFIDYNDIATSERIKISLIEEEYGEGALKVKIFKITHETKKEQGSRDSDESHSQFMPTSKKVPPRIDILKPSINESLLDESMDVSSKQKAAYIEIEEPVGGNQESPKSNEGDEDSNKQSHAPAEDKPGGDLSAAELSMLTGTQQANTSAVQQEKLNLAKKKTKRASDEEVKNVDQMFLNANKLTGEQKKDSDAEDNKKNKNSTDTKEKTFIDEVGSMISNTKDTLKKIKQLRAAMYEKYEPASVKQLKVTSQVNFIILITLTITFFFIQKNLLTSCQSSILSIYDSKNRMISITAIAYSTRMISYIANGYIKDLRNSTTYNFSTIGYNESGLNYLQWTLKNIGSYATLLKESQNSLSTTEAIIGSSIVHDINPVDINITFPYINKAIPTFASVDCWSSIMSLVTHAHNTEKLDITSFIDVYNYPESVIYIMNNAMNTILYSVNASTDAILSEIKSTLSFNDSIFKILLSIASASLIASLCILFPIAYKVARNKGHLLSLFMDITPKAVREQLKKCRDSYNSIRVDANDKAQGDDMEEDEEKREEKTEENNLLVDGRPKRNKKNYKKYATKFVLTVVKFIFFIVFLESYFIFAYFFSYVFLFNISHIANEVSVIAKRSYSNSLLFRAEIEMIGNRSSTPVLLSNSEKFIATYTEDLIRQQEEFLQIHSENLGYNDFEYNNQFDKIVYNSVCESLYNNDTGCNNYMGGILQKGLHSANVAFWDNMRELYIQYINSNKNISFLDTKQVVENEVLESRYLSSAYGRLQSLLNTSIESRFDSQNSIGMTVFLVYICVMIVVYMVFWKLFLEQTRTSLWVTKSMLSIIPPEVIENVKSINAFLKNTSISSLG